jgi:rhodanese-related sulfurtransferase
MQDTIPRIAVDELKRRLDRGETITLVDARSPDSYAKANEKIPNAVRVPVGSEEQHLGEVPRGRMVVTFCT